MKRLSSVFLAAGILLGTAVNSAIASEAPGVSQSQTAPCAICSVREGAGPEPVAATVEYEGKTYAFCSTACRDEFQREPKRWAQAASAEAPRLDTEPEHRHEDERGRQGGAAAPS
jgi:YHS domain-containing protein